MNEGAKYTFRPDVRPLQNLHARIKALYVLRPTWILRLSSKDGKFCLLVGRDGMIETIESDIVMWLDTEIAISKVRTLDARLAS